MNYPTFGVNVMLMTMISEDKIQAEIGSCPALLLGLIHWKDEEASREHH